MFILCLRDNPTHFRILLGERYGSSKAFREALYREVRLFIEELVELLEKESQRATRPLVHIPELAEAMVTVLLNVGADVLDLPAHHRGDLALRIICQLRMLIFGFQIMAKRS